MSEDQMHTRTYAGDIETTAQYMVNKVKNVNISWENLHSIHPDYIKYILKKGFKLHERFHNYANKFSQVCSISSVALVNIIQELEIAKCEGKVPDDVNLGIKETTQILRQFYKHFESEGYNFLNTLILVEEDLQIEKAKERDQLPMDRLSVFMRTADDWVERLYAEAKKTGVNLSDKPIPNDVILEELSHGMRCLQDGFRSFSGLLDMAGFDLINSLDFFVEVQKRPRINSNGHADEFDRYVEVQIESMIKVARAFQQGFKDFDAEMSKSKELTDKFLDQ